MSADLELWTRDTGDLRELLPRAEEWDNLGGDEFQFYGSGWLVSVSPPEEEPGDVPDELSALVPGLRYRISIIVEPSAPERDAWVLVRQILDALGAALGGAAIDPESGRTTSWATR